MAEYLKDDHRPGSVSGWVPANTWYPPAKFPLDLVKHVHRAIDRIMPLLSGSTADDIATELAVLATVMPSPAQGDTEARVRAKVYQQHLSEIPPDILAHACEKFRETKTFFPTISEIKSVALPLLARRRAHYSRLHMLLVVADNPAPYNEVSFDWYIKILRKADDLIREKNNQNPVYFALT